MPCAHITKVAARVRHVRMYFDVPIGTTAVTAYADCDPARIPESCKSSFHCCVACDEGNLHGLWKGDTVSVTETVLGARAGCSVQRCLEGSSALRRQTKCIQVALSRKAMSTADVSPSLLGNIRTCMCTSKVCPAQRRSQIRVC